MLGALDVHYTDPSATAACVLFRAWADAVPAAEHTARIASVAPYEPGEFRRRELPCLLAVLGACAKPPEAIVIDGYVWLSDGRPGLGAHLHAELRDPVPVIGVAKTVFERAPAIAVLRGASTKPLFVTAAGIDPADAARLVRSMHGPHRIPTLLKRADALARQG